MNNFQSESNTPEAFVELILSLTQIQDPILIAQTLSNTFQVPTSTNYSTSLNAHHDNPTSNHKLFKPLPSQSH